MATLRWEGGVDTLRWDIEVRVGGGHSGAGG
jgi:hypothetical protein